MRFLLIRGKAGQLVDPGVLAAHGNLPRYLGMRRLSAPPASVDPKETHLSDWYEPCEEIVIDDGDGYARKQAADGHLDLIAKCTARDHAAAALQFRAAGGKSATQNKKGGDS